MSDVETLRALPATENLNAISRIVKEAEIVALFLDFDGTISHIVPRPGDAVLDTGIRKTLSSLAARPDFCIAVVSGRALADVRERANIPNIAYVGNHGFEIESGSTSFREPRAQTLKCELRALALQLKLALGDIEGVELKDKALTLSVHLRRVAEHFHDWVRQTVTDSVSRSRSFTTRQGKLVLEVRPQVPWNKGCAVRWLLRESLPAQCLPIYIGDDITDEDAFCQIPEGITIKVGEPDATEAQYFLPDVASVGEFLTWLNQTKAHASLANSQRAGR